MGTSNERFRATRNISSLEATRNKLQRELDSKKTLEERRLFGQFSTPNDLAREIIGYGLQLVEDKDISFLEPAIGTGSFYSALLAETSVSRNISATGYEIDEQIFFAAQQLWKDENLVLFNEDFTQSTPTETVNLLVCNPPYVRHHLLKSDEKRRLCTTVKDETNITLSGLAGLYCHFLLLAHKWLKPDAICGWLIPSEFMDVNYGIALKEYLLKHVHLLRVHRYNPSECKFDDALVSSAVVWFKNEMIDGDYEVEFSFGGTHHRPLVQKQIKKSTLIKESKWTRFPTQEIRNPQNDSQYYLNNFFDIKRGIATGDNGFFILNKEQIENFNLDMDYFTPILPSPRNLKTDRIEADKNGFPILSTPLFLLDSRLGEDEIQIEHPTLWAYLQSGLSTTANKHLCKNRKKWYHQERRTPPLFLCSYMGRGKKDSASPFRFILNDSDAIATNSYLLLYPKDWLEDRIKSNPVLKEQIWHLLRGISGSDLAQEGRIYGGGLRKIEPKELGKVPCAELFELLR